MRGRGIAIWIIVSLNQRKNTGRKVVLGEKHNCYLKISYLGDILM